MRRLIKHTICELITGRGPHSRQVLVLISVTHLIAHLWLKLFNNFEDRHRNATRPKNTRPGRGEPKKGQLLIYKGQDKRLIIYLYPPFLRREGWSVKNNR